MVEIVGKKSFKDKVKEKSEGAKMKVYGGIEWCKQNKESIAVFGPVVVGGFLEMFKILVKSHTVKEEKTLKDRYVYDHSLGHYYELKRRPKNSEWVQIDQRKKNGESYGQILNDMRLLK